MKFLERDLEDIIFNTDNNLLNNKGLLINGIKKRQVRIGNYGIADLITISKRYYEVCNNGDVTTIPCLEVTIFELKRNKLDTIAFIQALRYVRGIKSYIEKKDFKFKVFYKISLVGKEIDNINNDFVYLTDLVGDKEDILEYSTDGLLNCIDFFTYSLDINGLSFNKHSDFKLRKEGF